MPVKIPQGCLLVQAGKQLEHMTGGSITAGYHEVVVTDETVKVLEGRKESNRLNPSAARPLWRISSTVFWHIGSDEILEPLSPFNTCQALKSYPSEYTGDMVRKELGLIGLLSE